MANVRCAVLWRLNLQRPWSREQDKTGTFYLLQIRPIVDTKEMLDEDLTAIPDEDVILRSNNSLGHGIMNEVYDIVYVKTDGYSASNNQTIAWEIEKMNQQFLNEGKNYVLVGPGRWGSSDTWLGNSCQVAAYLSSSC